MSRFPDAGQFDWKLREVLGDDGLLLGRKTYESFAGAWPDRTGTFADRMRALPKFVVSRTLTDPGWNNVTVLQGDGVPAIQELKAGFEGTLQVAGSHSIVQLLTENGLVDEYRLMVFPIVLGSGMRVFEPSPDAREMRLVASHAFPGASIVVHTYQPA